MKHSIVVVEDDVNIRNIVSAYLRKDGYQVTVVESGEEALTIWKNDPPDMWILDIMLPGIDGYELCKTIRQESEVPIIIISAKDEELDKILGLELGGDDYLTKPFSPREMVARVKRLFKRVDRTRPEKKDEKKKLQAGSLVLYPNERLVLWEGEEVEITAKEFEILNIFITNQNRAFSREELLTKVWGEDYFGSDRAVDDLIKRLRKKIDGLPVETVWGYGYRLKIEKEESK
ncbi:response regulator transcription factor [Sediminibacillus halophilus]|uniref:Two-component system, OmpR family, response regulator CssR n=1 Tax=Sediminibacillus halophilus TaxID=482461 RepID=A0A1G9WV71_9BACI|nr:response regulator transcription factor [Sediminibacillus halophilus]SDM88026.1 two-component system, OmpR family, response regulator CssR [Sediminibacillus halophilus]